MNANLKTNKKIDGSDRFLIYSSNIKDAYTKVLDRYAELSNRELNSRFLKARPWIEWDAIKKTYIIKTNLPRYYKMEDDLFNEDLVAFCRQQAENLYGTTTKNKPITRTTILKRIQNIEKKIISDEISTSQKASNRQASKVAVISSVEMDNVRDSMFNFKNSKIKIDLQEDYVEGDKYFITSEGANAVSTKKIRSRNADSTVTVSIHRQLKAIEMVSESSKIHALDELQDSLLKLDASIDMIWVILCDNFITQLGNGDLTPEGEAIITFDEIHFRARGKSGKHDGATIPRETLKDYVKIINTLSSFKANIKLNALSMRKYYEFSKNSIFKSDTNYSMDSNVINSNIIYKDIVNNRSGLIESIPHTVTYNLGLLGKLYLTETRMINRNIPTTALAYDAKKHSAAYNIYMKIAAIVNANKKFKTIEFNLEELIRIAHYEYDTKRKSLYIKRFLNSQVKKALDDAVSDGLIKSYIMPTEENLNVKFLDVNEIILYL